MTSSQDGVIITGTMLCRTDISNAAMAMLVVVPLYEASGPRPRHVEIGETFNGKLRSVFGGVEQRFGIGIVGADPRPRAVIAVQHGFGRQGRNALGQRGAPGQMVAFSVGPVSS